MLYLIDFGRWRAKQGGMRISQECMVAFTGSQEVIPEEGKQAQVNLSVGSWVWGCTEVSGTVSED